MRERLEVVILYGAAMVALGFGHDNVAWTLIGGVVGIAYFHAEQADERASKATE